MCVCQPAQVAPEPRAMVVPEDAPRRCLRQRLEAGAPAAAAADLVSASTSASGPESAPTLEVSQELKCEFRVARVGRRDPVETGSEPTAVLELVVSATSLL